MSNFRKMVLVPADQYSVNARLYPYSQKMNELEVELKTILDRDDIDELDKMKLYGQLLNKYLNFKKLEADEKKIKIEPSDTPIAEEQDVDDNIPNPDVKSEIPATVEEIISTIPKIYRNKVRKTIELLPERIGWDGKGRITINKTPIPDSNITNVLIGLVSDAKARKDKALADTGWSPVKEALSK